MRFLLFAVLILNACLVQAHPVPGQDSRLCAPFRGGIVDPDIVKSMLLAANEGRLYRIHSARSSIGFCVDSAIGRVSAEFEGVEGGFALRHETWGDKSQMLVMVDADTLSMEETFVKNMLKSEHFLDTYMYPKILFVSTRLHWFDDRHAVLEGDLTMHGVTRPVQFDVTVHAADSRQHGRSVRQGRDDRIVVTAKAFIKRSDFEMTRLSFLVSDTVELCMSVDAVLHRNK
jgi:polyisoprenoid-binding protein YceI